MSKHPASPMALLYREGRRTFTDLVPDGGARLDALFRTVPALGELAVGVTVLTWTLVCARRYLSRQLSRPAWWGQR